jgi:hypothetical protein
MIYYTIESNSVRYGLKVRIGRNKANRIFSLVNDDAKVRLYKGELFQDL